MTRFRSTTISIGLPKLATLILALVGGVAQVVNYSVISAGSQLHSLIALAIYFLIAVGIPPLTGLAFKGALHLPAWASYVTGALIGVAMLAIGTVQMGASLREWLSTAITVLSALGFSASVIPVPVGPPAKA